MSANPKKLPDPEQPEARPYRLVADKILSMIAEEGMAVGDRLRSERQLAAELAVSRAALREAFIVLELSGIVKVRSGSGVYVSARAKQAIPLANAEIDPGPYEVLSARRLIESEVASIAARVASAGAIDAIRRAVEELEGQHDDNASHEQLDRNFHLALAAATGNSVLVGMMRYLWDQRCGRWHKLNKQLRMETLRDQRRIYLAIAHHDPTAAKQAMRAHHDRMWRTFTRG